MRRLLKIFLWVLILAPTLLLAVVLVLTGTHVGTRWLISLADSTLPGELTVSDSRGNLITGVTLENIHYIAPDATIHVESLNLNWRLRRLIMRGVVSVEQLAFQGVDITLPATKPEQPQQPFAVPEWSTPLALELDNVRLQRLTVVQGDAIQKINRAEFAGRLVGNRIKIDRFEFDHAMATATANGSFVFAPPFKTQLNIAWELRQPMPEPLVGSGSFKGDLGQLTIKHVVQTPAELRIHGVVGLLSDTPQLDVTAQWQRLTWPVAGFTPMEQLGIIVSPGGNLQATGSVNDYRLQLQTTVEAERLPPVDIALTATGSREQLQLQNLQLQAQGGTLDTQGRVQWLPKLAADLRLQGHDLPVEQWLPESTLPQNWPESTLDRMQLDADVEAQIISGQPRVAVTLRQLAGVVGKKELRASGDFSLSPQAVAIKQLQLAVGKNQLSASGRLNDTVQLDLRIDAPTLENTLPELRGAISGMATISGNRKEPKVKVDLHASNLGFGQREVGDLTLRGDLDPQGKNTSNLSLKIKNLMLGEQNIPSMVLRGNGKPSAHRVDVALEHPAGNLTLALGGAWSGQEWQGQLLRSEIAPAKFPAWQQHNAAELAMSAQRVQLDRPCWRQQNSEFCLAADVNFANRFQASGKLTGFDLQSLSAFLPQGVTLLGEANAEFTVQGNLESDVPQVTLNLNYTQPEMILRYQSAEPEQELVETRFNALKLQASGDAKQVAVIATMAGEHTGETHMELTLTQLFEDSAALSGSLNTQIETLDFLSGLHTGIGKIGGAVLFDAKANGPLRQPQVQAQLQWREGILQLPRLGLELDSVGVTAALTEHSNSDGSEPAATGFELNGTAHSGEGQIHITGSGNFLNIKQWQINGALEGKHFQIIHLPDTDVVVSPDITFSAQPELFRLRGDLTVPHTRIALKELPKSAVNTSSDAVVHRTDGKQAKQPPLAVDAELNLQLGQAVHLTGFGLVTRLTGSLTLSLRPDGTMLANGVLNLVDGEFLAHGQKLVVERGTLVYSGPLDNPALDVCAVRKVGDVKVGLLIRGQAKSPETTVFSEPPMAEAEALAYLLLGRPLSQAGQGDGQMLQSAAIALGLKQVLPIAQQISAALGLDELTVEGDDTESTAIAAGQRLGEKLYLKYSYGVFSRIGALIVEYRINKNLSLETRSGEAQSIDLIYSVEKE